MERFSIFPALGLIWALFPVPASAATSPEQSDVISFGAKCDGIADDSKAFTAAIKAADPAKGGAGLVFVPPSKTPCLLAAPVSLPSGTTLFAEPGTATLAPVAPYPDLKRAPLLLDIKDASKVTVRGLSFDGRLDRVGTAASLITVYSADQVLFDQVTVQNARGISISFSGGPNGIRYSGVRNSHFEDDGTYYLKSHDPKTDRRQVVAFCCGRQDGTGTWNNQHNFASGNHWGRNGFDNLSIGQQSWFTAEGNHFGGTHNGGNIYCSHNNHIRIIRNTGTGAAGNGIDCFINDDLTITDNDSSKNGAAGIQADGTTCGLIADNRTVGNFRSVAESWRTDHPGATPSQHRGGITIGGGLAADTQGTSDVVISRNRSGDDPPGPTQAYGILVLPKAEIRDLRITPDNQLSGNTVGAFGGKVSGPTAGAAATPNCALWQGEK